MIIKGHLKLVILKLLSREGGKSGAELADEIGEKLGSKPSYGSIYPLLKDLEEKKILKKKKVGREKRYSLTKRGEKIQGKFQEERKELEKSVMQVLKTFRTIFEDESVNALIKSFERIRKRGEIRFPEILRIHELLLKVESRGKAEKVREILTQTRKELRNLMEK